MIMDSNVDIESVQPQGQTEEVKPSVSFASAFSVLLYAVDAIAIDRDFAEKNSMTEGEKAAVDKAFEPFMDRIIESSEKYIWVLPVMTVLGVFVPHIVGTVSAYREKKKGENKNAGNTMPTQTSG